jgi:hypothetical protein
MTLPSCDVGSHVNWTELRHRAKQGILNPRARAATRRVRYDDCQTSTAFPTLLSSEAHQGQPAARCDQAAVPFLCKQLLVSGAEGQKKRHGRPGGIRTPDPRFRKPLLYPSELQARRDSGQPLIEAYIRNEIKENAIQLSYSAGVITMFR